MRNSNPNSEEQSKAKEPETAEEYYKYAQGLLGESNDTKVEKSAPTRSKELSYTEQVNKLLKEVTVDESTGKFIYPDNTPEHLKYAVAAEKKYRDTQASFTKSKIELKSTAAEIEELRNQLAEVSKGNLDVPQDRLDELEVLKFSDPDEWYKQKSIMEQEATTGLTKQLEEKLEKARSAAGTKAEQERRIDYLAEFNRGRKIPVTTEMLENDIPPRLSKKLADGHLTWEGFLSEVDSYLSKSKVVGKPEDPDAGTTLTTSGGSSYAPAESDNLEEDAVNYSSMTF